MEENLMEQTTPEYEEPQQEEFTPEPPEPQEPPPAENPPAEPRKLKVKYNGMESEITEDEAVTLSQKGMNYDHVREDLDKTRAERERLASENARLMSVLNDSGFQGNALDIADRIEADRRQVTPEQVKYERLMREQQLESERKRLKETDPEFLRLKQTESQLTQFAAEKIRQDDLAAIKAHNPKESIKSVDELGALFGTLRLQGQSAVDAYEAVRAVNARKQPPTSMGDIGSQTEKPITNKYASMSQADFEKEIARAERGELKRG